MFTVHLVICLDLSRIVIRLNRTLSRRRYSASSDMLDSGFVVKVGSKHYSRISTGKYSLIISGVYFGGVYRDEDMTK